MQVVIVGQGNINQELITELINNKDNIIIVSPEERKIEDREFPLDILTLAPEPESQIKESKSWSKKRKKLPWE